MNYICTWFCADEKGEESLFPQTGKRSSSQSHQDIYWRCVLVFFITSRRFNKNEKHILFTSVKHLPLLDGKKLAVILDELGVEVIHTDFKYKTPKGYFGMFQNQFYEFSILEHITRNNLQPDDQYLILDSDCVFIKPAAKLFAEATGTGFLSYEDEVKPDYVINGLSRNHLKQIYEELLQQPISDIPSYHLGEFLLCSVKNINKISSDFITLWPILLERHDKGIKKFNEEAHTLSYLYYKNGLKASNSTPLMKRIWTNPLFYRNVSSTDTDLIVWHLPAEKTFGIAWLYDFLLNKSNNYAFDLSHEKYIDLVKKMMGVPDMPVKRKWGYYITSCYRALAKRIRNLKPVSSKEITSTIQA